MGIHYWCAFSLRLLSRSVLCKANLAQKSAGFRLRFSTTGKIAQKIVSTNFKEENKLVTCS